MKPALIRPLLLGVFAIPLLVAGQQAGVGVKYSDPGDHFSSNVPINELSARACRQFHHRFRAAAAGEYWFKWADGYKVSFVQDLHARYAFFSRQGAFRYSVTYFGGQDVPREATDLVHRRFPGYRIGLVTRVDNGSGSFYTVQITNSFFLKVLTISDGRLDVLSELDNGGVM
ncbi:MAG TPA: hypothetical protein VN616_10060 [Puia sp.]|nr:hypothetical protein [Puia sp.]